MTLEKDRCWLKAILLAIKPGRFNRCDFITGQSYYIYLYFYSARMNRLVILLLVLCAFPAAAQLQVNEDRDYSDQIHSAKLYPLGNQTGYPVLTLGGNDKLELHFDDMSARPQNYSYTFQLCNADWTPAQVNVLDFIKGYTQTRITTYRNSSIALTRYIHYEAQIPDRTMQPIKSGNYILKVFSNGDTSQLLFTRRFLVVQPLASVAATVQQPFNASMFRTHQKVHFTVNIAGVNASFPNQQIRVTVLQNNRWDNAAKNLAPTIVRQHTLEFNTEQQCVFPAGREWRWLDLRSFRLQSDRVKNAQYLPNATNITLRPDPERKNLRIAQYSDFNGRYSISTLESVNPFWQGDYANVQFSFVPHDLSAYAGQEIRLFGELTQYGNNPNAVMKWNEATGAFETNLFLKQGYYDYQYVYRSSGDQGPWNHHLIAGDNWETENTYTILVYYKPFGARHDELIGLTRVNSVAGRTGL